MSATMKFAVICVSLLRAAHADAVDQRNQMNALDFRERGARLRLELERAYQPGLFAPSSESERVRNGFRHCRARGFRRNVHRGGRALEAEHATPSHSSRRSKRATCRARNEREAVIVLEECGDEHNARGSLHRPSNWRVA